MPPHCDALDGPVVKAARRALEARDVNVVLPYVKKEGEAEVVEAFEKVIAVREADPAVRELADLYFFETVVRVHRAGEGAEGVLRGHYSAILTSPGATRATSAYLDGPFGPLPRQA